MCYTNFGWDTSKYKYQKIKNKNKPSKKTTTKKRNKQKQHTYKKNTKKQTKTNINNQKNILIIQESMHVNYAYKGSIATNQKGSRKETYYITMHTQLGTAHGLIYIHMTDVIQSFY